ncbi:MAG: DUF4390 domain-containing protein [Aquimonas sp.]|nr:DUF4390 domain-containing protein [Aquimonas sp.]
MASSSPHWSRIRRALRVLVLALPVLMTGCRSEQAGPAAEARIDAARVLVGPSGAALELDQSLRFNPRMLDALSNGIALRLEYRLRACTGRLQARPALWLRYFPLTQEYELRWQGESVGRRFERRAALLAALDRVRVPLAPGMAECAGEVRMQLDRAALPAPLRFPALIGLEDWRLRARSDWSAGAPA